MVTGIFDLRSAFADFEHRVRIRADLGFVQRPAIFLQRRLPCPAFQEADLGRRLGYVFWNNSFSL